MAKTSKKLATTTKKIRKEAAKMDANTIAKGAAVISIAAGVVAAGAYLSDKENRKKASHFATQSLLAAQDMVLEGRDEFVDRYQAVAMTIPSKKAKKVKVEAKKR